MKKIMTMVATIIMIATASAKNVNANTMSPHPHRVAPFKEVNVNVPARIKLVQGDDYAVMASTANSADTAQLAYRVKDGVLYISTDSQDMLHSTGRGTTIIVITPEQDADIRLGNDVQLIRKRK